MSASQKEREEFLVYANQHGLPLHAARLVLRHAATVQRCNEASCSYEWADRDRVPCPGEKDDERCICDYDHEAEKHSTVQRVERTAQQRERRISKIVAEYGLRAVFQGDPRGYCVHLVKADAGEHERGLGVPA